MERSGQFGRKFSPVSEGSGENFPWSGGERGCFGIPKEASPFKPFGQRGHDHASALSLSKKIRGKSHWTASPHSIEKSASYSIRAGKSRGDFHHPGETTEICSILKIEEEIKKGNILSSRLRMKEGKP